MPPVYQPITAYDYPLVLATQALDGELRPGSAFPSAMSPKERDTLAQRLKEQAGNHRVGNLLIDLATNPWVLLFVAESAFHRLPIPGKLFSVGEGTKALMKKHGGLLQAVGFNTAGQMLQGTAAGVAMQKAFDRMKLLKAEADVTLGPSLAALARNPNARAAGITESKGLLAAPGAGPREANTLLHLLLSGSHLEVARPIVRRSKTGLVVEDRVVAPIVNRAMVEARAKELGVDGVADSVRTLFQKRLRQMFGREMSDGSFGVDMEKIEQIMRTLDRKSAQSELFNPKDGAALGDLMGGLLRGIVSNKNNLMKLGRDERRAILEPIFKRVLDQPFYMPRNVSEFVKRGPTGLVSSDVYESILARETAARIAGTKSALPRTSGRGTYHPDDLAEMRKYSVEGSDERLALESAIKQSNKTIDAMQKSGEVARVYRVNGQRSIEKYLGDSNRTIGLVLHEVDDDIRALQRERAPILDKAIREGVIPEGNVQGLKDGSKRVHEVMDHEPGRKYYLPDVIYADYLTMNNRHVRRFISDVAVPQLMGTLRAKEGLVMAAQVQARIGLDAFRQSKAGKALRKGEFGAGFMRHIDELVENEPTSGGAKTLSGQVARYFYSTHLGLNMASVGLNVMQPFVSTALVIPPMDMVRAYEKTLKGLAGYFKDRTATGKVFLKGAEKAALLEKHLGKEAVEAAGLGGDAIELIDGISFSGTPFARGQGAFRKFEDFSMAVFEKAEWLNRLVTANASLIRHERFGFPAGKSAAMRESKRLVQETQYGADFMNTPEIFLRPESPLSNPLLRQFLTFPLRSAVGALQVMPGVLGEGNYMRGLARTFIRGMGVSAVVYETAKNALGLSLDKSLFASTIISPFQRAPVPPAVGIPYNIVSGALAGEDKEVMQRELPRLFPGGIALARALNVGPNLSGVPILGATQRQYVDWGVKNEAGQVAVRDDEGRLIQWDSQAGLTAKALGWDLQSFDDEAAANRYLLNQRDIILQYRRRALRSLTNGNMQEFATVNGEFEDRYGFKLAITQAQVKQYQRIRDEPRTSRLLNSLPVEARRVLSEGVSRPGAPNVQAAPTSPFIDAPSEVSPFAAPAFPPGFRETE